MLFLHFNLKHEWGYVFILSSSVTTDGGASDSVNKDVYSGGRN